MTVLLNFWVPGKPVTKGSWSAIKSKTTGNIFFKGPKHLKAWQRAVHDEAKRQWDAEPLRECGFDVTVVFFLPRPKTVKRPLPWGRYDGDVDKYLRAILDALTGVLYVDDAQVIRAVPMKLYTDANPGIKVIVKPFEEINGLDFER